MFALKLTSNKCIPSIVDYAVSVWVLAPILTDPPARKKPEVGLRVNTKAIDVSTGSLSPCAKLRGLVAGLAGGYISANVSVCGYSSAAGGLGVELQSRT